MIVTMIAQNWMKSISLPEKIRGQYWLLDEQNRHMIGIEGVQDHWVMKSSRLVRILDLDRQALKAVILRENRIYELQKDGDERFCVFAQPHTDDRRTYIKYWIEENTEISLGRNEQNDVCYPGDGVSAFHAVLSRKGTRWRILDLESRNGTFVNGKRVQDGELYPGDLVYIMGLQIVIGSDYIAINQPDGNVSVSSALYRFVGQPETPGDTEDAEEPEDPEYFYRSPRFKRDVETAVFKIDPPPASPITEELPWALVMGSSLAMGAMSLTTLGMAIANQNVFSMIMGGSMLTGTLLIPTVTKAYEAKRKKKKEMLRQEKYRAYLNDISQRIQEVSRLQEEILNENGVSLQECEKRILERSRKLWERGPGQNDFLHVRLGNGNRKLDAEFQYPERRFTLTEDVLLEEQYALCEKEKRLHNIPITYSLFDHPVSGVIGDRNQVRELAKSWMIQLAALYSYDEVKFIVLYDREDAEFDFVKWLPHVWSNDRKYRFLVTSPAEAADLSAYFDPLLETREKMNDTELEKEAPYYIVFSLDRKLAIRTELVRKILSSPKNLGFSLIPFYEMLKDLPKECSMVVELDQMSGKLFDKNDISGAYVGFTPDSGLRSDPLRLSRMLANTYLNTEEEHFKLPSAVPFLRMYGVGKVEHLNAQDRWKEHDPTKSLRAEVGVDTYGNTFMLDLHEHIHGPHGLVAGMTGSGKSEFLITYILSLAVNYHPNEVAFILIDYKGGGTAKAFEKLPHTAGIITNLDGAAIKRSLVSIESELKRRQEIFAAISKEVGISNIDIYKYQKLFREGRVREPLQHLFIIADEFAELKTQQPEFMSKLISAARIGRSLGIHLILATQKPSGVVDDQIWSNSRFRVCLKVQERADSVDMLKRPEAAELTDVGRFYLQVGYNELFELGQSAWAGAPYEPSDYPVQERDRSIEVLDTNGHVIRQVRPVHPGTAGTRFGKQLDAVVDYLQSIAREENIQVRQLWLDPIPAVIVLDRIREKYGVRPEQFRINPLIGVYDDPSHQRQAALCLPISREGNAIVYGSAGSGKTAFLQAMICSLIQEHTPDEVQLYLLDFSAETLRAFADAPQVGDVILNYESEKIRNLFQMLSAEINRRRKLFTDYGGDYTAFLQNSGEMLPSVVTVIHNYSAFAELFPEQEESVALLSREGTKYGVYFVLTAVGIGAVRFRVQQNFRQMITMQLNDPTEYSSVVGKTEGLIPADCRGRGLIRQGGLYEFQTASLSEGDNPLDVIHRICVEANTAWNGAKAPRVPVLPEVVDVEFLLPQMDRKNVLNIPIGVEKNSLRVHYYPFGKNEITMVESENSECSAFAAQLVDLLSKSDTVRGFVLDPGASMEADTDAFPVYTSAQECAGHLRQFYQLLLQRHCASREAQVQGKPQPVYEPMLVILNSYGALKQLLSEDEAKMLAAALENCVAAYGVAVVIAEQSKQMRTCRYESWYRSRITSGNGIWIGSGFNRQSALAPSGRMPELREELPLDYGYSLIGGKCVRLKMLSGKKEESKYEP